MLSWEHLVHKGRWKGKFFDNNVDDLIFTENHKDMFEEFKESMKREFDMRNFGRMKHFLGIEVVQSSDGVFICQQKYA